MIASTQNIIFEFDRNFGLELEFSKNSNKEFLSNIISKSFPNDIIRIAQWEKNVDNIEWVCKSDSSCGYEIASPVLNSSNDLEKIRSLVLALKENGAKTSPKCGIHVHIECKDFNIHQLAKVISQWIKCEAIIFCMFPKYRRLSKYCRPLLNNSALRLDTKHTPKQIIYMNSKRKHKSLNIRGYKKRGTIEFRLLEGVLRADDIVTWTKFCLYFFKNVQAYPKPKDLKIITLFDFWEFMKFNKESNDDNIEEIKMWILKRLKRNCPVSIFRNQADRISEQYDI